MTMAIPGGDVPSPASGPEATSRRADAGAVPTGPGVPRPAPSLLPYLRLVRAPAVFSALGDPLAGMVLAGGRLSLARAAGVSAAAGALYLAGMALNDYADRAEDARERPERPIPSGAVGAGEAAAIGSALTAIGVLLARGSGARRTGVALAASVLAYDFVLKSTELGPAAMGLCRTLSLLMGAEAAGRALGSGPLAAAVVLGSYIGGLTLLARGETGDGRTPAVSRGIAIAGCALAGAWLLGGRRSAPWILAAAALAAPAALAALRERSPGAVGRAVAALIRVVPALDGALMARRSPARAAAVALPLLALARWGRALIPIH